MEFLTLAIGVIFTFLFIMIFHTSLFGAFFICIRDIAESPEKKMRLANHSAGEALMSNISKGLKIAEERRNDAENSLFKTPVNDKEVKE